MFGIEIIEVPTSHNKAAGGNEETDVNKGRWENG